MQKYGKIYKNCMQKLSHPAVAKNKSKIYKIVRKMRLDVT